MELPLSPQLAPLTNYASCCSFLPDAYLSLSASAAAAAASAAAHRQHLLQQQQQQHHDTAAAAAAAAAAAVVVGCAPHPMMSHAASDKASAAAADACEYWPSTLQSLNPMQDTDALGDVFLSGLDPPSFTSSCCNLLQQQNSLSAAAEIRPFFPPTDSSSFIAACMGPTTPLSSSNSSSSLLQQHQQQQQQQQDRGADLLLPRAFPPFHHQDTIENTEGQFLAGASLLPSTPTPAAAATAATGGAAAAAVGGDTPAREGGLMLQQQHPQEDAATAAAATAAAATAAAADKDQLFAAVYSQLTDELNSYCSSLKKLVQDKPPFADELNAVLEAALHSADKVSTVQSKLLLSAAHKRSVAADSLLLRTACFNLHALLRKTSPEYDQWLGNHQLLQDYFSRLEKCQTNLSCENTPENLINHLMLQQQQQQQQGGWPAGVKSEHLSGSS
ncbi:hypothetical protein ACSSS7_001982 [Eimeria intestinalis]